MWARDWLSPPSWHCGEDSFFHLHRLTLWGSVSITALSANLKIHSGRLKTAMDQFWAALPSYSRTVNPCTGRLLVWASLEAVSSAWILALTRDKTFFLGPQGSSSITPITTWWGRKETCWDSRRVTWVAMARTLESLESMCEPTLLAWSSLYMVTRWGSSRPQLALGRKRRLGSVDRARPLHLFRNLVAMGWRWLCSQEIGRSEMERSHVRRGQMLTLKSFSFC